MAVYGEHYTKGCELLRKHLDGDRKKPQIDQRSFAKTAGLTPSFLNHLLYGRKRPGTETIVKLKQAIGIPVEAWVEPANPPKS